MSYSSNMLSSSNHTKVAWLCNYWSAWVCTYVVKSSGSPQHTLVILKISGSFQWITPHDAWAVRIFWLYWRVVQICGEHTYKSHRWSVGWSLLQCRSVGGLQTHKKREGKLSCRSFVKRACKLLCILFYMHKYVVLSIFWSIWSLVVLQWFYYSVQMAT